MWKPENQKFVNIICAATKIEDVNCLNEIGTNYNCAKCMFEYKGQYMMILTESDFRKMLERNLEYNLEIDMDPVELVRVADQYNAAIQEYTTLEDDLDLSIIDFPTVVAKDVTSKSSIYALKKILYMFGNGIFIYFPRKELLDYDNENKCFIVRGFVEKKMIELDEGKFRM